MTRAEAIAELVRIWHSPHLDLSLKAGLAEAIEALKEKNQSDSLVRDDAENCKESESKLDLISRRDVVNEIHKYFVEEIDKTPTEIDEDGDELYADMPTVNSLLACNKELSKRIKSLPSADPKTGEWVWSDEDASWMCVCCDCVFEEIDWKPDYNYCHNCGAKMYKDGEDK